MKEWFELLLLELGEQQWDWLASVGFQIKIGRPKFYAAEMIMPIYKLGTIVIGHTT